MSYELLLYVSSLGEFDKDTPGVTSSDDGIRGAILSSMGIVTLRIWAFLGHWTLDIASLVISGGHSQSGSHSKNGTQKSKIFASLTPLIFIRG